MRRVRCFGACLDDNERKALYDVADREWYTAGKYAAQFEREFAEYLGVRQAFLCNSGSSANLLALKALMSRKLGSDALIPGDEVITTACAFPTTVAPIVQCGLVPVFVDVEIGTYIINALQSWEAVDNDKTKAVMFANTCGVPVNSFALPELTLVEDNCDALGSRIGDHPTGYYSDLATHSFFAAHHITMGEGGCVATSDPRLAAIVRSLRDWGRDCHCLPGENDKCGKRFSQQHGTLPLGYDHKYVIGELGYNLKVTEMQAAIGCAQLAKLDGFITARKRNHAFLLAALRKYEDRFILPYAPLDTDPSWFCFVLTLRDGCGFTRGELTGYLESQGIETRPLFAGNILRHPAFNGVRCRVVGDLHNTEKVLRDTFFIGVWPGLDESDLAYVVEHFDAFMGGAR